MAKRKYNYDVSERVKVEEPTLDVPTVRYLQNQYPARIKYKGIVTNQWYEWSGAGAIVPVDERDALDLLSKQMNTQPCCNSAKRPQPKFIDITT